MYASLVGMNDTYNSFINLQDLQHTMRSIQNDTGDAGDGLVVLALFRILPIHIAVRNTFEPKTLIDVLSDLGGLYSTIAAVLIVVFGPLLASSFQKSLASKIMEKKSSRLYSQDEVQTIL